MIAIKPPQRESERIFHVYVDTALLAYCVSLHERTV